MLRLLLHFATFIIVFMIFSCTQSPVASYQNTKPHEANETSLNLQEAIRINELILYNIEKLEMGKMTKSQMDNICKPLKSRLDSVYLLMTLEETKKVDSIFVVRGHEMVDRIMKFKENK